MVLEEEDEKYTASVQLFVLQSSGRERIQLNDVYRQDAGYIVAETSPVNGDLGSLDFTVTCV
jgi:hypothetical protein